jgi:plastocyanin domain-containing protein
VTPIDWVVIALGAALILGELWFFLGPRDAVRAPSRQGRPQEIKVLVKGGYDPDIIPVEVGRPVRLLFYRDETESCSQRVVFDSLGIERELPAFETTQVDFTPKEAGDYPFRCGMSVLHGRVVAQVGGENARANLGKGHAKHG